MLRKRMNWVIITAITLLFIEKPSDVVYIFRACVRWRVTPQRLQLLQ
jgi:hypothetical protein